MYRSLITLFLSVCLSFLFGMKLVLAQVAPDFYTGSWPDNQGNYPIREEYHGAWQVVDPDPSGLNCRGNIPSYQGSQDIIATFPTGTVINAVPRERGVVEISDEPQDQPWLRVQLFQPKALPKSCWVRANQQYIMPIRPEKIS